MPRYRTNDHSSQTAHTKYTKTLVFYFLIFHQINADNKTNKCIIKKNISKY